MEYPFCSILEYPFVLIIPRSILGRCLLSVPVIGQIDLFGNYLYLIGMRETIYIKNSYLKI